MPRKPNAEPTMRTSVTLPSTVYQSLEDIAKRRRSRWRGCCETPLNGMSQMSFLSSQSRANKEHR